MKIEKPLYLVLFIILCQVAGSIGAIFTAPAIKTWYSVLVKPSFNPPNWIFGPVWTILYIMMGISVYLVWVSSNSSMRSKSLILFFVQLVLNIIWSILFFGLKNPAFALVDIFFLWISILFTIIYSLKVSKSAGYILIPYLLWVSFASILNTAIVILNK